MQQLLYFLCPCLLVFFWKTKILGLFCFFLIIITMFPVSYHSVHGAPSGTEVCTLTRTLRYHVRSQMLNTLSDDLLLSANIRRSVIICNFDLIHCSKSVLDIGDWILDIGRYFNNIITTREQIVTRHKFLDSSPWKKRRKNQRSYQLFQDVGLHVLFTLDIKKNHMTKDKNILLLFHNLCKRSAQENFLPCHRI